MATEQEDLLADQDDPVLKAALSKNAEARTEEEQAAVTEAMEGIRAASQGLQDGVELPEPVDATGYDIPGAQEAPEPPEPGTAENPIECTTAFLVIQEPDGNWVAHGNVELILKPQRPAGFNDFWHGSVQVAKDIQSSETAAQTAQMMQAIAMQAQAQMMEASQVRKVTQHLAAKGVNVDPRQFQAPGANGLIVPGR